MSLLKLPRWMHKWTLGLVMTKPARFFAMRYYDAKNFFEERKEKKKKAQKDRKTRVLAKHSSWDNRGWGNRRRRS